MQVSSLTLLGGFDAKYILFSGPFYSTGSRRFCRRVTISNIGDNVLLGDRREEPIVRTSFLTLGSLVVIGTLGCGRNDVGEEPVLAGSAAENEENAVFEPSPEEKAAITAIEQLEGRFGWRSDKPGGPTSLYIGKLNDATLEHLQQLTSLEHVTFLGDDITDAGLERLKGLANLRYLDLGYTEVTGPGLAHLTGLANLRNLGV